jgi:hypothetical protein
VAAVAVAVSVVADVLAAAAAVVSAAAIVAADTEIDFLNSKEGLKRLSFFIRNLGFLSKDCILAIGAARPAPPGKMSIVLIFKFYLDFFRWKPLL